MLQIYKGALARDIIIFSKVRLADVVDVNKFIPRESKAFIKIAYKHLDFLIMSPNLDLICAVELDDFTHDTEERQERDRFIQEVLQDCGIPLFRIKSKIDNITKNDTHNMEMCVLEYMAPTCPLCGRPMEPKESRYKTNYGHRFYGCMGWYEKGKNKCNFTIDID